MKETRSYNDPESDAHDGHSDTNAEDSAGQRSRRSVLRSVGGIGIGSLTAFAGLGEANPPPHAPAKGRRNEGTDSDSEDTTTPSTTMEIGVSDGSDSSAVRRGSNVEQWLETGLDVQNLFIPWDDGRYELDELFGQTVPSLWQAGRNPILTWELFLTTQSTPEDILTRVVDGEYDNYIAEWTTRLNNAAEASDDTHPTVYIRLGHEMNGNWYPWAPAGGSGTPKAYIRMWRHVREQVEAQRSEEIQLRWIWAANADDVGEYEMEELYPGDKHVDWVAVDCYNWGASQSWSNWQSPQDCFTEPVTRLQALSDNPVAITELGTTSLTSSGYDTDRKAEWISDTFTTLDELGVDMCVWFNQDKETDWAVFGGERGQESISVKGEEHKMYPSFANAVETYCR